MSEIKVNSIKGVGATNAAITVNNTDGTCTANLSNRQNRNLIINGAMQVAQRGTSSTTSGYGSVDRYQAGWNGGGVTQSQADVGSSDTPYTLGFRKTFKLTNTSTASGAGNYRDIRYYVEAQDIANSGWDLSSSSSNITLSFWAKASVAQTYYFFIYVPDSSKHYTASFALSANTWTKVTKTIPGASGLSVNNDNGSGLNIQITPFYGTNFTTSGQAVDTWGSWSGSSRVPDMTNTWAATTNATFELTGLQLEVGHATDFEHRSFAQELALCQRYFEKSFKQGTAPAQNVSAGVGYYLLQSQGSQLRSVNIHFKVTKRTDPTMTYFNPYAANSNARLPFGSTDLVGIATNSISDNWFSFDSTDNTPSPTLAHLMWTASAEL